MTCRKYSLPHLMLRGQGGTPHATAGLLIILLIGMGGVSRSHRPDKQDQFRKRAVGLKVFAQSGGELDTGRNYISVGVEVDSKCRRAS